MTESRDIFRVAQSLKPEVAKTWEARALIALHSPEVPGNKLVFLMIILAALGQNHYHGRVRVPRLGDNAMIKLDHKVYSQFTDADGDHGTIEVCTVDALNRQLGWLIRELGSDDAEREAIVNKINAWISRDETGLALHVEKMRASLDSQGRPIL
jgi:hypothetical protein